MPKYKFPEGFVWGTANSSYQIEGAVNEDGRGESIWERYNQMPENSIHRENGDVATDHYHRFREDVQLMKELGHKAYRFSVSWSRVLPEGTGKVNEKGLKFYSDLVDELIAAGIEPYLMIYHWDLPQALQDRGGWQNEESIQWFQDYCEVLYKTFHGRVKRWFTLNEPFCTAWCGNFLGWHAPGMRDLGTAIRVAYNHLRAHGAAVRLFRRLNIEGEIGIALNMNPVIPASDDPKDKLAAYTHDSFMRRLYFDPVFKGTFPEDVIRILKEERITLPDFKDAASICEPLDFWGLNYYNPVKIAYDPFTWPTKAREVYLDAPYNSRNWPVRADMLTETLKQLKEEYDLPKTFISENGVCYNDVVSLDGTIKDYDRIDYLHRHIRAVHETMENGFDIQGYFIWSTMDNYEWGLGKHSRFGLIHVDFDTLKRTPKESAYWYKKVIEENGVD